MLHVKIDTETGDMLGEYRTLSDGTTCGESSRTTVALDGSVWVGHRGSAGAVTHVGQPELNHCVDRNANGTIERPPAATATSSRGRAPAHLSRPHRTNASCTTSGRRARPTRAT